MAGMACMAVLIEISGLRMVPHLKYACDDVPLESMVRTARLPLPWMPGDRELSPTSAISGDGGGRMACMYIYDISAI